ncbi:MAG: hypothetical protein WA584_02970 [Pyrinomonadaceae bacterium]
MPKAKKKLSKNAKNALKILADSKLLNVSKAAKDAKVPHNSKSSDNLPKPTAAIKPRPDKKRG